MGKCPKCGEELDSLNQICEASVFYRWYLNKEGKMMSEMVETDPQESTEWLCPHCNEVIATNEEQVEQLLQSKDKGIPDLETIKEVYPPYQDD